MISEKYDVIVIGAGISGLLTALVLGKHGNRVLVLEKNAFPGGNCRSYRVDGFMVDTGPHAITMLRNDNGPLCLLMDNYFDTVPEFIPYGNYYIRSADDGSLVRCPTNVHDFLTFEFLPLRDRILLSSTIASVFIKYSSGKDYSRTSVYDCLPQSLSDRSRAFADAFSMFMSGRNMKETSVKRMAEGSSFSQMGGMSRDEFALLVSGIGSVETSAASEFSDISYPSGTVASDSMPSPDSVAVSDSAAISGSVAVSGSGTPGIDDAGNNFASSLKKLVYHKGGFSNQGYPVGGIGSILSCLLSSLPDNVSVQTGCRVRRILTENNKAVGVDFLGDAGEDGTVYADLVVHTGFAANLIRMLDDLPDAYRDQLRHIDHTVSITSWVGLDEKIPAFDYIGSEIRYEGMPYWGGPTSNYDASLAVPGGQVAGFSFVPLPRRKIRSRVRDTYDTLFSAIPGLEEHVVMKHAQITVPEKAAITINGEFADIRTPVVGLYVAGTDADKRSMGLTRAAYSVIELMQVLEEDGLFSRRNDFCGLRYHRSYLPDVTNR